MTPPATCVDLLRAMVAIPSVVPYHSGRGDSEREIGEYMASLASAWGFAVDLLPVPHHAPNLLVRWQRDPNLPWLVFDSHLDTVGTEGMTVDPHDVVEREGRLYGRGVVDTKGTGATMLWALRQHAQTDSGACNIAIAYTVAEEHIQTGARAMAREHLPGLGISPAGIIVGEPTRGHVVATTGGFLRWYITTHGKPCHSTRPERGHNAVSDMARLIVAIEQQYIAKLHATAPLVGRAVAAITTIRGGIAMNIIPAECVITLDRRLVPGENPGDDEAQLRDVIEAAAREQGMQVTISEPEEAPPLAPRDDLAFARRCQRHLTAAGFAPEVHGALYTSNANHYAAAGYNVVVLGPGDIAQAHTADEWIEVSELDRGLAAYRTLMTGEWLSPGEPGG